MSSEPRRVSELCPKENLGSLSGCLVDGDAEQGRRERRVKRRALAISILLQSAILAALILVPLFGKAERISLAIVTPVVPYGHVRGHQPPGSKPAGPKPIDHGFRPVFPSPLAPPVREFSDNVNPNELQGVDSIGDSSKDGANCSWCVNLGDKAPGPPPPQPASETPAKPAVIRMTTLDPAMLRHRVEPVYPPLAIQTHREGRVELRAIIGTDGTIRSLQVVSGDPLFYISAKEAVEQWLYKPTVLNGKPVEIDTYITVIYTTQH